MKTIYLLRHGKAESGATDIPDFERNLIKRGQENSLQVAKRLKKNNIKPSIIISSPAPRALATARIFAKELKHKAKSIKIRKAIYDQDESAFMDIVHGIDDEHDCIMIVGHNPSMNDFALSLTGDFKEDIPTSGIVGITFKAGSWEKISQKQGKCELFDFPKPCDKAPTRKNLRRDLERKITEQIVNVFQEFEGADVRKVDKQVKKSSKKLAKIFVKKLNP